MLCQVTCEQSVELQTPLSHQPGTMMKSRNTSYTPEATSFHVLLSAFLERLELSDQKKPFMINTARRCFSPDYLDRIAGDIWFPEDAPHQR